MSSPLPFKHLPVTSLADASANFEQLAAGMLNTLFPIGSILPYGGGIAPERFLIAEGQVLSRVTYAELFAAYGTSWGEGDKSTTFNLPDLRGKLLLGASGSHLLGESTNLEYAAGAVKAPYATVKWIVRVL